MTCAWNEEKYKQLVFLTIVASPPPRPLPQGVEQWDWSAPVNGMFSGSLLCYESGTLALKWLENQNSENTCTLLTPGRSVMIAALLKFIGAVGQSDIFYECPTKNVRVLDQISNRKYEYEKRLLLRCIHHFKSDLINNMDHMRISGTEPSSVILSQTK